MLFGAIFSLDICAVSIITFHIGFAQRDFNHPHSLLVGAIIKQWALESAVVADAARILRCSNAFIDVETAARREKLSV